MREKRLRSLDPEAEKGKKRQKDSGVKLDYCMFYGTLPRHAEN